MSLSGWNKKQCYKYTIDNSGITEDLIDFPVLLNIGSSVGKTGLDNSELLNKLEATVTTYSGSTFEGEDNAIPDSNIWTVDDGIEIIDNKLYSYVSAGSTKKSCVSNFYLQGDFDIQVDFELLTYPTTNAWGPRITASWSSNSYTDSVSICRAYDSIHKFYGDYYVNGSGTVAAYASDSSTSGKLRLVRLGTVFYYYYMASGSSSWTLLTTVTMSSSAEKNITVTLVWICWTKYPTAESYFSNFVINSGTVCWPLAYQTTCRKLMVVYPSVQEHYVDTPTSDVRLLIESNHTNGSTDITDSSKYSVSLTVTGDVHHSTSYAKIGSSSLYFDGTGDYIVATLNDSTYGNFTCACWIMFTSSSQSNFITCLDGIIYKSTYFYYYYSGSNVLTTSITADVDTWYHVALVRLDGTITLYIDGVAAGTCDGSEYASTTIKLGYDSSALHEGYMDQIIISYSALWTSDFTPPTESWEIQGTTTYVYGETEQLYTEIAYWGSEQAQFWVKVPRILCDQPTDLLLYYDETHKDNTTYVGTTGESAAQQVWDDNFAFVCHMAQDPTSTVLDSTQQSVTGTSYGSMTYSDLVLNSHGTAIAFDGSDDYIIFEYHTKHDITDTLTLEAFFQPSSSTVSQYNHLISRQYDDTDSYVLFINISSYIQFGTNGGNTQTTQDSWNTTEYTYYAGTYTSDLDGDAYINGQEETLSTDDFDSMAGGAVTLSIGGDYGSNIFDGEISEIRISDTVRSANWVNTSYYTLSDNLCTVTSGSIYQASGYTKHRGSPISCQVYLYDRASGELIDKVVSDENGYYQLTTTTSGVHNLVCLDADVEPDYDDLIISKVTPVEVL